VSDGAAQFDPFGTIHFATPAMSNDPNLSFALPALRGRKIPAAFDGG
jgi:hypothetical protein